MFKKTLNEHDQFLTMQVEFLKMKNQALIFENSLLTSQFQDSQYQNGLADNSGINMGGQNNYNAINNADLCVDNPNGSLINLTGSGNSNLISGSHISGKCPAK